MKLPDDYFLDTDNEMLILLERENKEMIEEIIQGNDKNKQTAQFLFNLLLTGSSGSFLLVVNGLYTSALLGIAVLVLSLCWSIATIYILIKVIKPNNRLAKNNRSSNLYSRLYKKKFPEHTDYFKQYGLINKADILRRYQLINQENTINELLERNEKQDEAITKTMFMAICPLLIIFLCIIIFWIFA